MFIQWTVSEIMNMMDFSHVIRLLYDTVDHRIEWAWHSHTSSWKVEFSLTTPRPVSQRFWAEEEFQEPLLVWRWRGLVCRWLLGAERSYWLIASKERGTSVLNTQKSEFGQNLNKLGSRTFFSTLRWKLSQANTFSRGQSNTMPDFGTLSK